MRPHLEDRKLHLQTASMPWGYEHQRVSALREELLVILPPCLIHRLLTISRNDRNSFELVNPG